MFDHMSNEEITKAIAQISEQMKGPMPNLERRLLHEDRKDLRGELERREYANVEAPR